MHGGQFKERAGARTSTRTYGSLSLNKYTEFTEALATGQTVCIRSYYCSRGPGKLR